MLLHRVRLQGFLAHHGQEIGGQTVPIEMDFRAANLWLMHGANGSGKSTVFDAITFALFDQARGSKFLQLVNDACDTAHVEVEFEVKGQTFLVKRRLKLNKARDSHSMWGEVSRWNATKEKWEIEGGVGNKIEAWATKTLQISYANFASSVILKQGEADRFLKAKPSDRKDRLMELLDLDIYKRLGAAANAHRTSWNSVLKQKQTRLDGCLSLTKEELTAAEKGVSEAQMRLKQAREEVESAQKRLDGAVLSANLTAQIGEKERLQAQDAAILGEEASIEAATTELESLNAVLPLLRALKEARRGVKRAQQERDEAERLCADARAKAESLKEPASGAAQEHALCDSALKSAQETLKMARGEAEHAQNAASTLHQIEGLETQIADARLELEPHAAILGDAPNIEKRRIRIQELRDAGKLVKAVDEAHQKLGDAEKAETEAAQLHSQFVERAKEQELLVAKAQAIGDEIAEKVRKIGEAKTEVEAELRFQNEVLLQRRTLGVAVECPTCGTHLPEDACQRLLDERNKLEQAVVDLRKQLTTLNREFQTTSQEKTQSELAFKTASKNWNEAKEKVAGAQASWRAAQQLVAACQTEWQGRREDAGEFADFDFDVLKSEAQSLGRDTIQDECKRLEDARRVQLQCDADIKACGRQLNFLPGWDEAKRVEVKELATSCAARVEDASTKFDAAEKAASSADAASQKAKEAQNKAQNATEVAEDLARQRVEAGKKASENLKREHARLSPTWAEHAAARDDKALGELENRSTDLEPLAARRNELNAAKERRAALQGAIDLLRNQKAKIPPEHCVLVDEAQDAHAQRVDEATERQNEWDAAHKNLEELGCARRMFEACLQERDEAEREAARYGELAGAFGRDGLQAKIVREAQHSLTELSNGVLGRLSNGQWQIDLRGDAGTELEIIARDDARGGVERTFDCLSGGERFRVAISLAIAIGQMACGGAPMNTLVIDEGFGALDEENRGLMVDNLRHLSQHELQNGRIIVVSHQDDVCEAFGHRYRLSRDSKGYARVEMMCG